jgi:hypothetical protein
MRGGSKRDPVRNGDGFCALFSRPATAAGHVHDLLGKMRIVGTLNVRTKCGFKPLATQMRCTAARLTPAALAMVRVLQCVASAGFSWVVFSRMSRTILSGMAGSGLAAARLVQCLANPVQQGDCPQRDRLFHRSQLARCLDSSGPRQPRARFGREATSGLPCFARASNATKPRDPVLSA